MTNELYHCHRHHHFIYRFDLLSLDAQQLPRLSVPRVVIHGKGD